MKKAKFFKVKSFTDSNIEYDVRLLPNGEWRCSCPYFCIRHPTDCKHIRLQIIKTTKMQIKEHWRDLVRSGKLGEELSRYFSLQIKEKNGAKIKKEEIVQEVHSNKSQIVFDGSI